MDFSSLVDIGVATAIAVGLGRELRLFRQQVAQTFAAINGRLEQQDKRLTALETESAENSGIVLEMVQDNN